MRIRMTVAALLVAILAAVAGACGGGAGDPEAAVEDFFAAASEGDGATACDLVTENGLEIIGAGEGAECEDAFEQLGPLIEAAEIELVGVETTSEDGDTATVEATVSSMGQESTDEVQLVDEDGWKIEASE